MVFLLLFFLYLIAFDVSNSMITNDIDKNISDVAIALSEIINALKPRQLTILVPAEINKSNAYHNNNYNKYHHHNNKNTTEHMHLFADENIDKYIDDFIYQIHKLYFKSVIFYDVELFFQFIESNLQGSTESVNLIFCKPFELSQRLHERKLSHRLSLFLFYWGAKYPPKSNEVRFEEPMRAVVITRPRRKAIYYNQAVPDGMSHLKLVNWYDGDNLGLQKVPLLPNAATVYSNFHGRVFRVPVFHSPPWFWVNYANDSDSNMTTLDEFASTTDLETFYNEFNEMNVTGGRDHRLLSLLAEHMNFQFVYIEVPGRTQGSLRTDSEANETFTGGIGLLQNSLADFFLGDVGLSWERRKAIEFSFFTLADSGAFATHAPRRLNEALAIMRPFKMDVWPYLILTILLSGPIFYIIIALPFRWRLLKCARDKDVEKIGELTFHMVYIHEITIDCYATRRMLQIENSRRLVEAESKAKANEIPKNLLDHCIWFTVQLFLKQSCQVFPHGNRAKFLMIVYWIAATYVLADVYSAQLTSQFARPAHEQPINTLHRLERAMLQDSYKLFVEKESSSLEMLENGTEIFRHLYALMKKQGENEDSYLIDSVEAGIKLIADGFENKAVLGGRETLYFNIQQHGSKTFQLSQKLYTRYSAVAVQIGCPFLDSLNDVLIHLFEGGILDKMTTAEYEAQSRMISKEINDKTKKHRSYIEPPPRTNVADSINNESNGKGAESAKVENPQDSYAIQPLNLRMLQGAFIALLFGYCAAAVAFVFELIWHYTNFNGISLPKINCKKYYQWACRKCLKLMRIVVVSVRGLNRM